MRTKNKVLMLQNSNLMVESKDCPKPLFATLPDNSIHRIYRLLGKPDSNTKLAKSQGEYRVVGLSLAAEKSSGYQVCPKATLGCKLSCIFKSGLAGVFPSVNKSRILKTRAYFQNRGDFLYQLHREIEKEEKVAISKGQKLAVRLNVFSDIPWETQFPTLFRDFPNVQFYDYHKVVGRMFDKNRPKNYHLTFSRSESNHDDCMRVLRAGFNVAVVFENKEFPKKWNGFRTFPGDDTDLRFLDPSPRVIALYAKGPGKQDKTGFVVRNKK